MYTNQCLRKYLIPHIKQHYSENEYVFWPDLASAHYGRKTIAYLEAIVFKVKFIAKVDNPPKVPETRPIEDFWGILKNRVYKNGWVAKSLSQLRRRVKYCISKFDQELAQGIAQSTMSRLRFIRRNGLIEDR